MKEKKEKLATVFCFFAGCQGGGGSRLEFCFTACPTVASKVHIGIHIQFTESCLVQTTVSVVLVPNRTGLLNTWELNCSGVKIYLNNDNDQWAGQVVQDENFDDDNFYHDEDNDNDKTIKMMKRRNEKSVSLR
ncbi:hypothetical protein TYRP_015070 [Tyrophagus putrescentiae]|nr:hypothetical protein TYRP_015070 [Tyrophagus putrescentiae]